MSLDTTGAALSNWSKRGLHQLGSNASKVRSGLLALMDSDLQYDERLLGPILEILSRDHAGLVVPSRSGKRGNR